jgi:hypothetical protein
MPAVKDVGEPGAGEPHARFDEAAGGIRCQSGSHMPHGAGASRRPYRHPVGPALSLLPPSGSRRATRKRPREGLVAVAWVLLVPRTARGRPDGRLRLLRQRDPMLTGNRRGVTKANVRARS